MSLQSLDIRRLSATTVTPPQARSPVTGTVAKLIDVSKCIGCKACQTACMEWNDLSDEIGENVGVYDNPADLDRHRHGGQAHRRIEVHWLQGMSDRLHGVERPARRNRRERRCVR